jgi:hypothetical protein
MISNVYSRGQVKEKLNYMHANPVARKLVSQELAMEQLEFL